MPVTTPTISGFGIAVYTVSSSVAVQWTPSTALVDDICLAVLVTRNSSGQTISAPAGWSSVGTGAGVGGGGCRASVFYRRVTAADVAAALSQPTFTFTLGTAAPCTWMTMLYRDVDTVSPINTSGVNGSSSNGTALTAPSVTTTYADCKLVQLWGVTRAVNTDADPNYGASPAFHRGGFTGINLASMSDQALTVAGSTGTVTLNLVSPAAPWVAHMVALKAVGVPPLGGWGVGQVRMGAN